MTPSSVLLRDDPRPGVRRLTLNRPRKRNALSNELRGAILVALQEADADASVKAHRAGAARVLDRGQPGVPRAVQARRQQRARGDDRERPQ